MKIPLALEGPLRRRSGPDHAFVKNLSNGLITPCGNLEKVPTLAFDPEGGVPKGLKKYLPQPNRPIPEP